MNIESSPVTIKSRVADTRLQTQRSRLQLRRCALNEQINKELRLKAGAENLLKATRAKQVKEHIELELNFVNSNLQLLKDELLDLSTSVEAYQNEKSTNHFPLIAFGTKETREIQFVQPFKDYIIEHYSADASEFAKEIERFEELRRVVTEPARVQRNAEGVKSMMEYYNYLYFVEKRFFPPTRNLGVYFHWFDSLGGEPAVQKSPAFEKGAILFNLAALYTQIGAKQDRNTSDGLTQCVELFCRSAGVFCYLRDNFSHSPQMDMRFEIVEALKTLALAQAQECFFDLQLLLARSVQSFKESFLLAKEAAQVALAYGTACSKFTAPPAKDYLPDAWTGLITLKHYHFQALAHSWTAAGVLAMREVTPDVKEMFRNHFVHTTGVEQPSLAASAMRAPTSGSPAMVWGHNVAHPPESLIERKLLAKAQLLRATVMNEDALEAFNLSKQLRQLSGLRDILLAAAQRCLKKFEELDTGDDDFAEPCSLIRADSTSRKIQAVPPDFKRYRIRDPFEALGPLAVFNAKCEWSAPRIVHLQRTDAWPGFGFSVKGDAPVCVSNVESGGLADRSCVRAGDYIVAVQRPTREWVDAKALDHETVVELIRESASTLVLSIVTPKRASSISSSSYGSSTLSSASGTYLAKNLLAGGDRSLRDVATTGRGLAPLGKLKSAGTFSTWNIRRLFGRSRAKSKSVADLAGLSFS